MNLKVRVENQTYNVTVGPTKDRPILVDVEGVMFEVWPELVLDSTASPQFNNSNFLNQRKVDGEEVRVENHRVPSNISRLDKSEVITPLRSRTIRAPIPGVITAVFVTPGSEVRVGEELLKLEAMKMNNSILSNHSGVIRDVHITVGQVVKHNEILLEFAS